ncbi:MAG: glycine--tRNA ligase subunit beta [Candidatus Omnitrophota bacterium]
MKKKDFILEIGAEELPAKIVAGISEDPQVKASLIDALLGKAELGDIKPEVFATPRRIVIYIQNLPDSYTSIEIGPPKQIAFDKGGKPTKALEGFLRRIDATVKDIEEIPASDKEKIKVKKQVLVKKLLADRIPKVVPTLSTYKNMLWDGDVLFFPRPIRWILAVYADEVIKCSIGGLLASNITYGHRLLSPQQVTIKNTGDFFKKLKKHHVIYSFQERKSIILNHLTKRNWHKNEQLLDEVAGLVEYPYFIDGIFDKQYLKLPQEVLIASTSKNQRIFPLQDKEGKLTNRFIAVINGNLKRQAVIRRHYEQVLDAKLKDALFFYNEDLQISLAQRTKQLNGVIFHKELGSYADKAQRLKRLLEFLKTPLELDDADYKKLIKAIELCKADLLTQMVGEFPSLQGIMGKYYALAEGVEEKIAQAIEEHYCPRFAEDKLPQTKLGLILALLDKFDSVICHFKAGNQPKGNWDLYALRRQCIAIINIIVSGKINLSLESIFGAVFDMAPGAVNKENLKKEFMLFFKERLSVIMLEQYKFRNDLTVAVISSGFDDVYNFFLRLAALCNIIGEFYFEQARCVVERTNNITRNVSSFANTVDTSLFEADEETQLFKAFKAAQERITPPVKQRDYCNATKVYGETLFDVTHKFFDKVMVNVDNGQLRNNRLKLLKDINELYVKQIADLSQIQGGERDGNNGS